MRAAFHPGARRFTTGEVAPPRPGPEEAFKPQRPEATPAAEGRADGICTVTLNRPDRLNAVTATMLGELREAWDRADADDTARAVIVTGAARAIAAFLEKRPARFTLRPSADLPPFYPWWRPRSSTPSSD